MTLERSFPVPVAGEGRPDYSSSIVAIKRGETYTQFEPRANEKMKIFLAAYSAATPLAAGATDPLIDFETFLPAIPYTSPAGWRADFREWMFSFNGAVRLDTVSDDFPALVLEIYPQPNYLTHTYEQIIFFDTIYWDPLSLNAHGWNFTITNVGANPVRGAVQVAMVLTDIASSYPETKRVKCLKCGHVNEVELRVTRVTCESCLAAFAVPFFPGRTI
jgi:hypothetical protein